MPTCDWQAGPNDFPEPPCTVPARKGHSWCDLHIAQDRLRRENEAAIRKTVDLLNATYPERPYDDEGNLTAAGAREIARMEAEESDSADARDTAPQALTSAPQANQTVRRSCDGHTRKGLPCTMPPLKGRDRCVNHVPEADTRSAASRAAQASALARRYPSDRLLHTVYSLTDRASIQATIDTTTRLVFAGRISNARAVIILRACAIAIRNFDRTSDTITGPRPQKHDWFPYFDKVKAHLSSVDPLLDEATARDIALRELASDDADA